MKITEIKEIFTGYNMETTKILYPLFFHNSQVIFILLQCFYCAVNLSVNHATVDNTNCSDLTYIKLI